VRYFVALIAGVLILTATHIACAAEFIWARGVSSRSPTGILYSVGPITEGDYDRFVAAIKQWGAKPLTLELRSGGGNVGEALKIGRLVRQLSLSVSAPIATADDPNRGSCVSDTAAIGKAVPCICASACTLIWFGGVMRFGAELFIHSIKPNEVVFRQLSPAEAHKYYQSVMRDVHSYLTEMEVSDRFYDMMTNTSSMDLQRVPLVVGLDPDVNPPSYREWIAAKCSRELSEISSNPAAYGTCTIDAQNEAQIEAIRQFLGSQ